MMVILETTSIDEKRSLREVSHPRPHIIVHDLRYSYANGYERAATGPASKLTVTSVLREMAARHLASSISLSCVHSTRDTARLNVGSRQ